MTAKAELITLPDPEALAHRAADILTEAAVGKGGKFAIALSGGSTPRALYALLSRRPYGDIFPWAETHWFWGDERFVPHDDPLSNYRMVWEAMLSHVPVPAGNIHAVPTAGVGPKEAAQIYQKTLQAFYGSNRLDPDKLLFDINLLGLGTDGHTASLFPGTDALKERDDWVVAVTGVKDEARISLTYPALNSSRQTIFLVAGADKKPMLSRLMQGDQTLPAAHIHPAGQLSVLADAAAVSG